MRLNIAPRVRTLTALVSIVLTFASSAFADEFEIPETLDNWQRLSAVDERVIDPFTQTDIGKTRKGWLTIIPQSNAWYQDFRGGFLFGEVEGNFTITTRVRVSSKNGEGLPRSSYSLAGLLLCVPRDITPQTWKPGEENALFYAFGTTDRPGNVQFQSMNTVSSQSVIERSDARSNEAMLRLVRIDSSLFLMRSTSGDDWEISSRYTRTDFPERLQVGLIATSDWPSCEAAGIERYNRQGVEQGNADLMAQFDYVRWQPLGLDEPVRSRISSDPSAVDSGALISVLKNAAPMKVAGSFPDPDKAKRKSSTTPNPTPTKPKENDRSRDDLAKLSDEFDDPETLKNWLRVYHEEKSNADQLQKFDINATTKGWMTLVPFTSSWYQDYRGVLVHKRVKGDFIATAKLHTAGRSGQNAPDRHFSLAGIMVRTPRNVTSQTWRAGQENYIFLSHGSANQPGRYQFEVKTTINSDSQLEISDASSADAEIRVVRIGAHFITLLREPEQNWRVHRRYRRQDMPAELQVGITVYTDWQNVERLRPEQHNRTVIKNGNPDLVASFDYFRFARPKISEEVARRNWSNTNEVSDVEVLRAFGDAVE
ncbi:MAG: hypothetical protein O2955_01400 [Planctomycetota bacterium]|nr:hypothetical protein [Planctomycetota bacterium]MDA1211138.1 hypothetical protein [Planctomycetota bacterium]